MIWIVALIYHGLLIWAAYRVGDDNPAYGFALIGVGVVVFQLVILGPASFIDTGCVDYGVRARDC